MFNLEEKSIKECIRALEYIKGVFQNLLDEENKKPGPPPVDHLRSITNLRLMAKSSEWPFAVPPDLICGEDDNSKINRATNIVQEFLKDFDLNDKKVLDFGTGEGYVPYVIANLNQTKLAMGYDIEWQNWSEFFERNKALNNFGITDKFEEIIMRGPYDIIILNDVLDHVKDPLETMQKIKDIKAEGGKIVMRCHPWTSRHGSHIYKQLNKAYLHLVFSSDELYAMGLKEMPTTKILDPMSYYRGIIDQMELKILKEEIINYPVDLFFSKHEEIMRRIKDKFSSSLDPDYQQGTKFPREILEIQFVDYVLE